MYHYLQAHPQVYVPRFKAPEFFAGKALSTRGIDWYRRQFAGAGPEAVAIGEASNVYTKYPKYPGVPRRIAEVIPDVKLLYIVREPISRIRSHYVTRVIEGSESLPFGEAVATNPIYLDYSRYTMQLEQYLEHFDRDQLLVITAEALRDDREAFMRTVYGFLGVDSEISPPDLDREFYRSADKPSRSFVPLRLRKALKRHFPATKRFKELEARHWAWLGAVRGATQERPRGLHRCVDDESRSLIVEALAPETSSACGPISGDDFDGWGIA